MLPQGPEVLGLHLSDIVEDTSNDIAVVARLILSCNEHKTTGASWMHASSLKRCIYPALSANSHQSAKYVEDEIKISDHLPANPLAAQNSAQPL